MTTAKDIMKQIKDNDVKFVDLRFTDPKGKLQHVTMDIAEVEADEAEQARTIDITELEDANDVAETGIDRLTKAFPGAVVAQAQLGGARLEGTAGGGLVTVTLIGHLHLVGLHIEPGAVDPDDLSMLEDLIRAAWQDAHDQVARLQAQTDPLGGLGGAGGLGDLFGGG